MQQTNEQNEKYIRRQAAIRRSKHNVFLAGVFLLMIVVFFLANLIVADKEFSDTENRSLAQKPQFSWEALWDGSYFDGLTAHYADQFFARDGWISLKMKEDSLLGRKDVSGVFLGSDGYLIPEPETPDAVALENTIQAINGFAASHKDISMRMMVIPGASAILKDRLPENAPVRDQLADIEVVRNGLFGNVQFLDVTDTLKSHANEDIYYHTDHHWTSLGAYYAFQATTGLMGIGTPVSDYDIYRVTNSFEGTLSSKSGSHEVLDSIDIYVPKAGDLEYFVTYPDQTKTCSLYESEMLEAKDKYTVFFGGNHSLVEIRTTADTDRNLLIFKDSYANAYVQFLVPYYDKIFMVDPRYYYDDLNTILTAGGVTDVLFLYSGDTILTDTSLTDVLESLNVEKEPLTSTPETAPEAVPAPAAEEPPVSSAEEPAIDSAPAEVTE